jgi:hypothetical protein
MNGVHSGWNALENYGPAVRRLAAEPRKKPEVRRLTEAGRMSPFEQAGQNDQPAGNSSQRKFNLSFSLVGL